MHGCHPQLLSTPPPRRRTPSNSLSTLRFHRPIAWATPPFWLRSSAAMDNSHLRSRPSDTPTWQGMEEGRSSQPAGEHCRRFVRPQICACRMTLAGQASRSVRPSAHPAPALDLWWTQRHGRGQAGHQLQQVPFLHLHHCEQGAEQGHSDAHKRNRGWSGYSKAGSLACSNTGPVCASRCRAWNGPSVLTCRNLARGGRGLDAELVVLAETGRQAPHCCKLGR